MHAVLPACLSATPTSSASNDNFLHAGEPFMSGIGGLSTIRLFGRTLFSSFRQVGIGEAYILDRMSRNQPRLSSVAPPGLYSAPSGKAQPLAAISAKTKL